LQKILAGLPRHYRQPIIVVLHLADDRESRLAELFSRLVAMPVREAADKEEIGARHRVLCRLGLSPVG
jgi:two-component system chemotaxis response regulator CheB